MRGYLVIEKKFRESFFNVCFDFYWKDDVDISNEENIRKILKITGTNIEKFFKNIQDQKIKDKLKDLTNDAFKNDIFGAPTFVVNKKIFWGQDRLDYAIDEYNS